MPYTQKEMCEAFQITRNTLRHYEALGIIHPKIDGQNGYRRYGFEEVRALHDCKSYQAMGLTLAEARDLIYTADLDEQAAVYASRAQAALERARYEMAAAEVLALRVDWLRGARDRMGAFRIIETEDWVFAGVEVAEGMVYGDARGDAVRDFMRAHFEACVLCLRVTDRVAGHYEWGYAMSVAHFEALGGPLALAEVTGAARVLSTVLCVPDEEHPDCSAFDGLIEEAGRRGLAVAGDPFGILLTRSTEADGRRVRYIEGMVAVSG